ncbi:MAG: A24 family peptidase [Pseudomonadota bacterium]
MTALLAAVLVLLAIIDLRRQVLPDLLTLPLLVAGLVLAGDTLADRALAAAAGWVAFASLALAYRRLRGVDGLGGGDAKLLAAAGAWVGTAGLPWVVLLAASGGLAVVGALSLAGTWSPGRRLPFGPFLAAAFLAVWWGLRE